ncbi:MAG: hypothetical protein WC813_02960 [Patescibacteria group bacterium]|jgi:hypothetical protein
MFTRFLQAIISAGAALAVFSILATGMYYVMPVTTIGLIVCAVAGSAIVAVILRSSATKDLIGSVIPITEGSERLPIRSFATLRMTALLSVSLLSLGLWWHAVLTHPILESVRSPWLVINSANLLWLFIPAVCAAVLLIGGREDGASPVRTAAGFGVIVITLFSALSFAAAAYPLGFGFDPFLHRATIQHIAEHGTITPKPLYYIGEYVIELFAMKVLHLPLMLVDVFLVPLLAATLIPAAVFLRAIRQGGASPAPTAAILLFLPIAAFVQTTPQALAFVFTTVAILITQNTKTDSGVKNPAFPIIPSIFAVAALTAHPIAGLLAVFFVVLNFLADKKRAWFIWTSVLATFALPFAFIAQSFKAHQPFGIQIPGLHEIAALPLSSFFGTHFNAWGDTAYLVIGNMFLVTVTIGIFGAWRMHKGAPQGASVRWIPLICAGIAFSNFLILGLFFEFPFLISYERTDFAARMLTLTVLFLMPYMPYAMTRAKGGASPALTARRAFGVAIVGVVFVSSVYGAFPRYDAYASSAGFNVTKADFDAVKAIEEYAAGRDYVVLANQATSSAAISTLGFKKYYHGDIYFYPIPTGGQLYQLYLAMADKPREAIIDKARALTGAQLVFFVMDDYWWDSKRVVEQTKTITDITWTFGDHEVMVMVFE